MRLAQKTIPAELFEAKETVTPVGSKTAVLSFEELHSLKKNSFSDLGHLSGLLNTAAFVVGLAATIAVIGGLIQLSLPGFIELPLVLIGMAAGPLALFFGVLSLEDKLAKIAMRLFSGKTRAKDEAYKVAAAAVADHFTGVSGAAFDGDAVDHLMSGNKVVLYGRSFRLRDGKLVEITETVVA